MSIDFQTTLTIREWLNGALIPLNASLTIATGTFIARAFRASVRDGVYIGGWRRFKETSGIGFACVLFWIFVAQFLRASGAWASLRFGDPVYEPIDRYVTSVFVAGALILMAAELRCAHLLTCEWAGHRYWVATVCMMVAFWIVTA